MGKPDEIIENTEDNLEEQPESEAVTSPIPQAQEKSSNEEAQEKKPPITLNVYTLAVGEVVDVLDSSGRWCEAEVTKVDREKHSIFASYLYWDRKFDEWINDIPGRVAPLNTHTYFTGGKLKVGQRIEVLDERQEWLEAFVIEETEKQVKIHYKNYHSKFDVWLDRDTVFIRPYGRHKFVSRPKTATLWSTGSLITSHGSTVLGKLPASSSIPGSSSSSSEANNQNRVRYIGDDTRTRKIQNLSEQFNFYRRALEDRHLTIMPVSGDGNCLFRSVSHQVYGDDRYHDIVRQKCMDYMESEAEFFSQFVVGGKDTFHLYLQAKRRDGCWGDDPEIEAICELYNRPAEIWAYDAQQGARKLRTFHETSEYSQAALTETSSVVSNTPANRASSSQNSRNSTNENQRRHNANQNNVNNPNRENRHPANQQDEDHIQEIDPADDDFDHLPPAARLPVMRLSYYGGGHYDSIVDRYHSYHILQTQPGILEDINIARSRRRCNPHLTARHVQEAISSSMEVASSTIEDIQQRTDIEATDQATLDLAIQQSRTFHMNHEYDDLETCLALSLNYHSTGDENLLKPSGRSVQSDSKQMDTVVDNAIAVQGDVFKSVQEQSEREFMDQAIISSLVQDPVVTEEELLQAALLSSVKEAEAEELQRVTVVSSSDIPSTNAEVVDPDMEIALKLSSLSEEEAFALALSQSLQQTNSQSSTQTTADNRGSFASSTPTIPVNNNNPTASNLNSLSEEELLQLAMAESLQSFQQQSTPKQTNASSSSGGMMYQYDDLDYDEDLMKAIQESLK